jgi:hypothetical protein
MLGHNDILVASKVSNKFENIHFRKYVHTKFSLLLLCAEVNPVVGPRILRTGYVCLFCVCVAVCVCVCVCVRVRVCVCVLCSMCLCE